MKTLITSALVLLTTFALAQTDQRVSTLQFVQIIDDNTDEALYYFQNNWRKLREKAVEQGIIASYEFIRTERTDDYPIDIILMTTFQNEEQYDNREKNFQVIMEGRQLDLLNELKPGDFRKTLFVKEKSAHSFDN